MCRMNLRFFIFLFLRFRTLEKSFKLKFLEKFEYVFMVIRWTMINGKNLIIIYF